MAWCSIGFVHLIVYQCLNQADLHIRLLTKHLVPCSSAFHPPSSRSLRHMEIMEQELWFWGVQDVQAMDFIAPTPRRTRLVSMDCEEFDHCSAQKASPAL